MAERKHIFKERISDHLNDLVIRLKEEYGENSQEYKAIYHQYFYNPLEDDTENSIEKNQKHYEAALTSNGLLPKGVERLYKRHAVIEITMVCSAHCRYCLRQNYDLFQITRTDIAKIVSYCSQDPNLKELLITGGDPFMVPKLLMFLVSELVTKAPNIKIIRIATRMPTQNPTAIDLSLIDFLKKYSSVVRFEIATQINHSAEITEESIKIFDQITNSPIKIYSQNVLLKGVNDNIESLVDLYDKLRYLGIEAHYLFHAVPILGTGHLRTSLEKGLTLAKELTSSGKISGRCKPMFALMTDVGKVTLYDGSILKKDENSYLVKTFYKLSERKKWNPDYQLPKTAYCNENGCIEVEYIDGRD